MKKHMKNMKDPRDIAHDLNNEIANCMYDLGEGDESKADDMYNDPDVMSDMLGDRLFEACNCFKTDDDTILAWEVTDILLEIGHDALKEAVNQFKERHELI